MVQLCLGQPFLHFGRGRDVSREFFNLHQQGAKLCLFVYEMARVARVVHLVEPRADVRAHDKLDALDFGLHEHDARVLCLGRVRVPS
jgi:hypothetical protein